MSGERRPIFENTSIEWEDAVIAAAKRAILSHPAQRCTLFELYARIRGDLSAPWIGRDAWGVRAILERRGGFVIDQSRGFGCVRSEIMVEQ